MSKRREVSSKRAVGDPAGGPLPLLGLGHGMAAPLCLRCSAMAELPCWGARGSARRRRFALLSVFSWFSGLFSKHRSRMNVILEPLRSYLRYGHNGSCFVGFREIVRASCRGKIEGCRENELSGAKEGDS